MFHAYVYYFKTDDLKIQPYIQLRILINHEGGKIKTII